MMLRKINHGNSLHYCQQRMYIEGTWNNLITVKKKKKAFEINI